MNTSDLIRLLEDGRNSDNAGKMSAYMRGLFPFYGIKAPDLKAMTKEFQRIRKKDKDIDWSLVHELFRVNEREAQYVALTYLWNMRRRLTPQDLPALHDLICTKSHWDSVDSIDQLVGEIVLKYPESRETMLSWAEDEDFWVRRCAIDHQLAFKDRTDRELLEKIILKCTGTSEFFINKAIGWSLREFSKTDPQWVADFIERNSHLLSKLSIREASKYLARN